MTRKGIRLRHGDFVLVTDGSKALLLANEGDALTPDLRIATVLNLENPATRDQGTDRPGHFEKGSWFRRGAFEASDLHDGSEAFFAARVAQMLDHLVSQDDERRIVLVAAPRMLGHLRSRLSARIRGMVAAERDVDLVNRPLDTIETLILGY